MSSPVFPDFTPTVAGLLEAARTRWPHADAVVAPDGRLTYAELDARSRSLAARLVEVGVGKGTHVAVMFPNGVAWVVAWAAAARIGAVVVPANTFYAPAELVKFLRHADVEVILGVSSFLQHDYAAVLESHVSGLREASAPLYLEDLPNLRRVLLADPGDRSWAEALDGVAGVPESIVDAMESSVTPADPMLITYTSGSTGEPKGVVHSNGALIRHARNLAALAGVGPDDRLWTPMPLCWVGGFAFTLLRAMTVGAAFTTLPVFQAEPSLEMIAAEKVTIVSAWPAVLKALSEHPVAATLDLSSVRAGFYEIQAADRRPPDPGLAVGSLGMSETCGPHTFWRQEEEIAGAPEEYRGTFGHEVPGTQHRVIDPSTGGELAPGDEGEVLVRGYSLMQGLYKRERDDVLDADGWYHTGDRGYFRDGWFFFTGRQTDLIKTSGANVAPAEVEAVLLRMEGVKLAFAVGVPHPDRGQDVVALVVPWAGTDVDPDALRERLRGELSSYKVPRRIVLIADTDVPYLTSQKPDRRALVKVAVDRT